MKLGLNPKRPDQRHLHLREHLASPLLPPLATWDGTPGAVIAMLANDTDGDCVLAAIGNGSSVQSACEGTPGLAFDAAAVRQLYRRLSPNDTGLNMISTLSLVGREAFLGRRIPHFAGVDFADRHAVMAAACAFSGVAIGVSLPPDFLDQFNAGLFDVSKPGDPELGHALYVVSYDDIGPDVATWGRVVPCTWDWFDYYVREAYVLLDEARAAASVDWQGLVEAAAELARQSGAGG